MVEIGSQEVPLWLGREPQAWKSANLPARHSIFGRCLRGQVMHHLGKVGASPKHYKRTTLKRKLALTGLS